MGGSGKVRTVKGRGGFALLLALVLSVPLTPTVLPAVSGVEPVEIRALTDPSPAILFQTSQPRVDHAQQRTAVWVPFLPAPPGAAAAERGRFVRPVAAERPEQAPAVRPDCGRAPPSIS